MENESHIGFRFRIRHSLALALLAAVSVTVFKYLRDAADRNRRHRAKSRNHIEISQLDRAIESYGSQIRGRSAIVERTAVEPSTNPAWLVQIEHCRRARLLAVDAILYDLLRSTLMLREPNDSTRVAWFRLADFSRLQTNR